MAVADDVEHEGLHLEEIERALRGFAIVTTFGYERPCVLGHTSGCQRLRTALSILLTPKVGSLFGRRRSYY